MIIIVVTVSLDRQKDILGDFSMNPTYLFINKWYNLNYRGAISEQYFTIRLGARVFNEQIVNEAQPSWLSLIENEGE